MVDYIWPWAKGTRASQEFAANPNLNADPNNPNPRGGHTGLDAALPAGTPLRAEADGTVVFEGWANLSNNPYLLTDGGGIGLVIDFGNNKPMSLKGHLSSTFVSVGDQVKQGQIVCESGNTGRWTTGPHCHEEFMPPVYFLTSPTYGRVNPRNYCTAYWEDVIALQPAGGDIKILLKGYQRETQTKVWERTAPDNSSDITKVKLWDEETIFDFGGYVIGADPFGDGNRTWFKGRYSDVYFHSSAFKDMDTHDLPNLTPVATVPTPPIIITPAPEPKPEEPPVVVVPDYTSYLHGADISEHQGKINAGVLAGDFIGIKATEGDGWLDPEFYDNEAEARTVDRPRIFYHFARPDLGNTAAAELRWFLSVVGPKLRLGDIMALDWEAEKADLSDVPWADAWLTGAQDKHGGTPLLYAGARGVDAGGARWEPVETRFPLWYPAYGAGQVIEGFQPGQAGARPPVVWNGKPMLIWQYTSNGRLAGYPDRLDLNVFMGTRADLTALGITKLPATTPEPKPEEPAKVLPTADQPIQALIDYYKEQTP